MYKNIYYEEKYPTGQINKYWIDLANKKFKYSNGKMLVTSKIDNKKLKRINFWTMAPILNLYKNGKFLKKLSKKASACGYSWEIKFENEGNEVIKIASNSNKDGHPIYKKPFIIKLLTSIILIKPEFVEERISRVSYSKR